MGLFDKGPKPPDPVKTAEQQAQANRAGAEKTLDINALDRTGPFGGATFQRNAEGVPTGQTVDLAPKLEQTSQAAQGSAAQLAGFLPQNQFSIANDVGTGDQVRDSFFNTSQALLAPGRARQQGALRVSEAERGLPLGSEASRGLFAPTNEANAFQDVQLAGQAIQLGGAEQDRLIRNTLQERATPGAEAGQALGLLNQLPTPSFAPQPSAGVNPVDVAGITQQNFQNESQIARDKNAALGSILGAGATIATGGLGAGIFGGLGAAGFAGSSLPFLSNFGKQAIGNNFANSTSTVFR